MKTSAKYFGLEQACPTLLALRATNISVTQQIPWFW